jgi:hypothetical protein
MALVWSNHTQCQKHLSNIVRDHHGYRYTTLDFHNKHIVSEYQIVKHEEYCTLKSKETCLASEKNNLYENKTTNKTENFRVVRRWRQPCNTTVNHCHNNHNIKRNAVFQYLISDGAREKADVNDCNH